MINDVDYTGSAACVDCSVRTMPALSFAAKDEVFACSCFTDNSFLEHISTVSMNHL